MIHHEHTPVEQLHFSQLTHADAVDVAALEHACFALPWTEKQYCMALEQKAFSGFGLRDGGALVAYVVMYHTPDELEILNIAVRADRRQQGYGRRLLLLALRTGIKMGILNAVLEVRPSNTPARALYEGLGFIKTGVRPKYYPDTAEDAFVYTLRLTASPEFQA